MHRVGIRICLKQRHSHTVSVDPLLTTLVKFILGRRYSRDEIFRVLGGNKQAYLPVKNGRVLYGAFKRQMDPEAPHIVLPGDGPSIVKSARLFARQADPVPIFLKHEAHRWEYVGFYRVHSFSDNPAIVNRYAGRASRTDTVTMVLFLEYVGDLGLR